MITSPFKDLKPGFYGYGRPGWGQNTRVEVYVSQGYQDGETLVRFVTNYYGQRLHDLPADSFFVEPSDSDIAMR